MHDDLMLAAGSVQLLDTVRDVFAAIRDNVLGVSFLIAVLGALYVIVKVLRSEPTDTDGPDDGQPG